MSDDLLERLGRGCNCGRCKLDLCCCTAMEEAKAEIEKLREALRWFLYDPRFVVQVGGNPNVVPQMIEAARAALGETK